MTGLLHLMTYVCVQNWSVDYTITSKALNSECSKYLHKGALWGHSASVGCLKVQEYRIQKDITENKIMGYK